MMNYVRSFTLFLLGLSLLAPLALAEKAPSADPEKVKTDSEFNIQGEYTGIADLRPDGKVKVGVQIIALGDGKFGLVGYAGGLPGDGWETDLPPRRVEGVIVNGVATFNVDPYLITVKDGLLKGKDGDRDAGTLRKVIRKSPTLGAKPPENAKILFAGKDQNDFPSDKVTEDGLLMQGSNSKSQFQSCTLHLEFMLPFEPKGRGQGRGNSGCYPQGRYEVQILDSFGLEGKNNECGGIYTVSDPAVNMCFPPMSWQTYDIDFTAAQFDAAGKKTANARMTVKHNGVVVQNNVEIDHATTAAPVKEGPQPSHLHLQDHGHPVRFQNIWIVEKP
jgi:hypothetical protein